MRTQLLAATALTSTIGFLVPGMAFAQPASIYDWSGFYAGLGVGGIWSNAHLDFDYSGTDPTFPGPVDLPELGKTGTVKLGHNWQTGNFVYSIEEAISVVDLHGTHALTGQTVTDSLGTLLSLRARLGAAFDRMMLYSTAGIDAGNASFHTDRGYGAGASGVVVGPEVGVGVEYAVTDKLGLTLEGRLYQLSQLHGVGDNGYLSEDDYTANYRPRGAIFEAGLNVHF